MVERKEKRKLKPSPNTKNKQQRRVRERGRGARTHTQNAGGHATRKPGRGKARKQKAAARARAASPPNTSHRSKKKGEFNQHKCGAGPYFSNNTRHHARHTHTDEKHAHTHSPPRLVFFFFPASRALSSFPVRAPPPIPRCSPASTSASLALGQGGEEERPKRMGKQGKRKEAAGGGGSAREGGARSKSAAKKKKSVVNRGCGKSRVCARGGVCVCVRRKQVWGGDGPATAASRACV